MSSDESSTIERGTEGVDNEEIEGVGNEGESADTALKIERCSMLDHMDPAKEYGRVWGRNL